MDVMPLQILVYIRFIKNVVTKYYNTQYSMNVHNYINVHNKYSW